VTVTIIRTTTTDQDPTAVTAADTDVPPDREAPAACPYCDRPFASVRARNLHVGEVHPEQCTDAERRAYEDADDQEMDELFLYHIKAVVVIGVTWGLVVMLYMVALGSGII
jgi:NAD-dependent SIR2 family protein deacetylase